MPIAKGITVRSPYVKRNMRISGVRNRSTNLWALPARAFQEGHLARAVWLCLRPKKEQLVSAKGTDKRNHDHPGQCQVSAVCGKSSQHQNGLALEECPNSNGHVSIGVDQGFQHSCLSLEVDLLLTTISTPMGTIQTGEINMHCTYYK